MTNETEKQVNKVFDDMMLAGLENDFYETETLHVIEERLGLLEDYTVYQDNCRIGKIQLESMRAVPTAKEMPQELEVNGFVYRLEGAKG